jgi:Na+-transporting NADH:ubiquinone oxidoreductase subunit A
MVESFRVARGLSIPLAGEPDQAIDSKQVSRVAIVTDDTPTLKPTMLVSEGEQVKLGQPVISDKQTGGVIFTAPTAGTVRSVVRGDRRRLLSVIFDVDPDGAAVEFPTFAPGSIAGLSRETVSEQIVASGLWTAFRTRPFSRLPRLGSTPQAIFVNAMDTNPLAVDPRPIIADARDDFAASLEALTRLTDGNVFVCRAPGADTPGVGMQGVRVAEFAGPHPAGLTGTHMHFLKPASAAGVNWSVNYQDTIAIGRLFLRGRLIPERVISLAGPVVTRPRLIRTQLGAALDELVAGELQAGDNRVISGSVLCGRRSVEPTNFLGRYHLQVSCLLEGRERELFGWQKPGFKKFSITRAFASALAGEQRFALTTSTEGSERAMVPIGTYEKVMPLDILPTLLLRALITRDTERAQELGCLELDEEDLALCTVVCPGKYEYAEILRDNLVKIEREG